MSESLGRGRVNALLLAVSAVAGCVEDVRVPFTVLDANAWSNIELPPDGPYDDLQVALFSDQAALDDAMRTHIGYAPPTVDFTTHQAVLVYLELAGCVGPDLVVQSVVAPTSTLEVTAALVWTDSWCGDVLNRPYTLIGVDASGAYTDVVGEFLGDQ